MAEFDITDLNSRVDIVELVNAYGVRLKRSGSEYKGLCPFHDEKTASFMVDPIKGVFHCFGCQKSGNAITFVMEKDGLTFKEAVQKLATRYGLDIRFGDSAKYSMVTRQYNFLAQIAEYFNQCLRRCKDTDAPKVYLTDRRLSAQAIDIFKLGYVPRDANVLIKWAEKHGFSTDDLKNSGIVLPSDKEHPYPYNRFGGRIVFPLFDKIGRVVGFSGRLLKNDDNAPKYINSPDSDVFHKRKVLFGLNLAAPAIAKSEDKRVIICEGPIDVIRCHVNGFCTAVASQGTSFTEEHVDLVKTISNNVTIAFDGDVAGNNATVKTGELFLAAGVYVKIAQLPAGQDPDSFIRDNGSTSFSECLRNALPLITFRAEQLLNGDGESASAQERLIAAKELLNDISKCESAVMQELLLEEAANCLKVSVSALKSDLKKPIGTFHAKRNEGVPIQKVASNNQRQVIELALLQCLFQCLPEDREGVGTCLRKAYREDHIVLGWVREFVRVWMSKKGKLNEYEKSLVKNKQDEYLNKFNSPTGSLAFKVDDEVSSISAVQEILRHLWMEHIREEKQKNLAALELTEDLQHHEFTAYENAVLSESWEGLCGLISRL